MTAQHFAWPMLSRFKRVGEFLPTYPESIRRFFSPLDDVHGVLAMLLSSAQQSLIIALYGYDDDELDKIIREKCDDEHVFVQMSLDRSQAGGKHEAAILAEWNHDAFGTSIAIGTSSEGGIGHTKMAIVDGLYVISGSTNWSGGGEGVEGARGQNNELTVTMDAMLAGEARAVIDRYHDAMLAQMKKRAKESLK